MKTNIRIFAEKGLELVMVLVLVQLGLRVAILDVVISVLLKPVFMPNCDVTFIYYVRPQYSFRCDEPEQI